MTASVELQLPPALLESKRMGKFKYYGICILQHVDLQVVTGEYWGQTCVWSHVGSLAHCSVKMSTDE